MTKRSAGARRTELVELVRSRRATVAEAAERAGVSAGTAYRWLRAAAGAARRPPEREATSPAGPAFVELVRAAVTSRETPALVVRWGEATIEVRRGCDRELLREVLATLRGAAA